jgi:hypothetical protein
MFVSYKNSAIFANFLEQNTAPTTGQFFLATDASFSVDSSLEANKVFGESRIFDDYNVAGFQVGKFSATFLPLIGSNSSAETNNQMALITGLLSDFEFGHRIKFGNLNLRKCYLSNLGLDISPQSPVKVSADFDVYDLSEITGQSFTGQSISHVLTNNGSGAYLESIHALAMGVSGSGVNLPDSKERISISYNIRHSPIYNLGDIYPSTVILESVEKQVSINGENVSEFINFSGGNAILNLAFHPFSTFVTGTVSNNGLFNICTTGRVVSQNLDVSPDGIVGQINLVENVF